MLLTDRCRAACSRPLQTLAHQSSRPHSKPPCSSPAGHFKRLLGASQIPIKGPGRGAHPRKRASQGDMIKSTLLGGGGLAGAEWREKKTGYQAEGIILYLSHIFPLSLSLFIRSSDFDTTAAQPLSLIISFFFSNASSFSSLLPPPPFFYPLLPLKVTSQVI